MFVRFAGALSPWWLLIALPALLLLGWYLYRKQFEGLDRGTALGLFGLRALLLGGLLVLAFQPNLVCRNVKTYPGRVLVAVDDSESMTAADNAMPPAEALYLARSLNGVQGEDTFFHRSAAQVQKGVARLRAFERFSAGADRSKESFWNRVNQARKDVLSAYEEAGKRLSTATNGDGGKLQNGLTELRDGLSTFFKGESHPGSDAFSSYYETARAYVETLLQRQWAVDRNHLANGGAALKQRIQNIRGQSRLDLLKKVLATVPKAAAERIPDQGISFARLVDGSTTAAESFQASALSATNGHTDILGRLREMLEKERQFPLSAVLLFSDGRHLGDGSVESLAGDYAQRNVPVFAGLVGSANEPVDLAVLEVISPPFAVTGVESRIRLRVKAALDEPAEVTFRIRRDGNTVHTVQRSLGRTNVTTVELPFTPSEAGLHRYSVGMKRVSGEVFPERNNTMDFAMHVRENRLKVLYLDSKPRWETRFALNVFRRLEYVELNSIVAVVQPEGTVKRGVQSGTWPENEATLEMYDLVILGPGSREVLNESEWNGIADYVRDGGGSVGLLHSGVYREENGEPILPQERRESLFPLAAGADTPDGTAWEWDALSELTVAQAGRYHSATDAFLSKLSQTQRRPDEQLRPHSFSLMQRSEQDVPVIASRHVGKGKVLLIGSEYLWKVFNPDAIRSHARLYVGLVSWAVEGGSVNAGEDAPSLVLNRRSTRRRKGLQVWTSNVTDEVDVQAVSGGEVLATASATAWDEASGTRRAVFDPLPARNLTFRLKNNEDVRSSEVVVTERYDELSRLSLNRPLMTALADRSGGFARPLVELQSFLSSIPSKERVETEEDVWQLWDMPIILLFLAVMLTVEWVWRKFAGLI